jgi:hypothetical protein
MFVFARVHVSVCVTFFLKGEFTDFYETSYDPCGIENYPQPRISEVAVIDHSEVRAIRF